MRLICRIKFYTGLIEDIDFLLFGDGTTNNTDYTLYRDREAVKIYQILCSRRIKPPLEEIINLL